MKNGIGVVALFLMLAAAPVVEAGSGPQDVLAEFMAAFNARDAVRTALLYSPGAEFMPPDGPPLTGRAAIQAAFAERFKNLRTLDLLSLTSARSGQLAFVTGRLTISSRLPDGRADIVAGSYLAVLRQVGGAWKIAYHIFNLPLRPDFVG
jgi:ketosteroid isomerase-like protein